MSKLIQIIACILSALFLLSTVSCSLAEKETKPIGNPTSEHIIEKAYQLVKFDCTLPLHSIRNTSGVSKSGNILLTGEGSNGKQIYITDKDLLNFIPVNLKKREGNVETYYNAVISSNDIIYVLESVVDYGAFELPDYNDPDFDYKNYDYGAMEKAAEVSFFLYTIDENGNILTEVPVSNIEKYLDENDKIKYNTLTDLMFLGENSLIVKVNNSYSESYAYLDISGTIGEKLELENDDTYFPLICNDKDNNIVYISDSNYVSEVRTIDAVSKQVNPDVVILNDNNIFKFITTGTGAYKVYLSDYASLFGMTSDGTIEEVLNWIDSGLNGDNIESIIPLENNEFIVFERSRFNSGIAAYLLTKRDKSEISNVQVISMAVNYSDDLLVEKVKEFNMLNSDFHIKIEDYNRYYEWDEEDNIINTPENQFKQDLALGKKFDIVCMDGNSSIYKNLAKKDALVDLYEYLGLSETVNKEELMPNIINIGEVDGELAFITPFFNVMTYAAKTKFCDKENWSVDDLIEVYENLPQNMTLFKSANTKETVLGTLLYGNSQFIDYENGICTFDSDDFIKLLEFSDKFSNINKNVNSEYESSSADILCRNDKALLDYISLSNIREYSRAKHVKFGDDITLVGIPSSDGCGAMVSISYGFAIMNNSEHKDVAWKFISTFFEEEFQFSDMVSDNSLPALKSAFAKKLDESTEKPYRIDSETGNKTEYDDFCIFMGEKVIVPPLTVDERNYIEKYVTDISSTPYYYDDVVNSIIYEEAAAFFEGDKTAKETAEIIQNRISILVSEQS